MLSFNDTIRHRTLDIYFPFSFCSLNRCAAKILFLMRKFEVLHDAEEEVSHFLQEEKDSVYTVCSGI